MNKSFTAILFVMMMFCFSNVFADDPKPDDEKEKKENSDIEKKVKEILKKHNSDFIDEEKLTKELVELGESAVPFLIQELNCEDFRVILVAAFALDILAGEKALSDIVKANSKLIMLKEKYFETDASKYSEMIERNVLNKMFQLIVAHKDIAIPHLINELENQKKNEDLKYELIIFIMSIDTCKAIDAIQDIYQKEISKEIKLNILVDYLFNKDKMNKSKYLKDVYKLMEDDDKEIKGMAIRTVGLLKDSTKIDKLIELTDDKEFVIRMSAMYALREIGTEKAIDAVIKNLKHECEVTRSTAALYLGEVVTDDEKLVNKIVKALIETLSDKDDNVRYEAISALSYFRDLSIIPHLEKIAKNDSDELNRDTAKEAIKKIKKNKKKWDRSHKKEEESESETK